MSLARVAKLEVIAKTIVVPFRHRPTRYKFL